MPWPIKPAPITPIFKPLMSFPLQSGRVKALVNGCARLFVNESASLFVNDFVSAFVKEA